MQCLYRRPSGIYSVRLIVPERLRQVIGKAEFVASTGSRQLFVAKVIGTALLAQWRARFAELSPLPIKMDIKQVSLGSPLLSTAGFLPIAMAAQYSGLEVSELLSEVRNGTLGLFYRAVGLDGNRVSVEELPQDTDGHQWTCVVPPPNQMPATAVHVCLTDVLGISTADCPAIATVLLNGGKAEVVLFECLDVPGIVFAPDITCRVQAADIALRTSEVEAVRQRLSALITPEQLTHATSSVIAPKIFPKSSQRLSVALDYYVKNKLLNTITSNSEIQRIRNGIALMVELEGDPVLSTIDVDMLRKFRDEKLSTVPANENHIRMKHGTTSVTESIRHVAGTDWRVMSAGERDKKMTWIGSMLTWLHAQKWISDNPASGVRGESVMSLAERKKKKENIREVFSREDLAALFSADFFATGRGKTTKKGVHHSFSPYHYWLPLIGALTGARINEICQLDLADIKQTEAGTWYFSITDESEESSATGVAVLDEKRLKNKSSRRLVPVHPLLINLGLLDWVNTLRSSGHARLFPELKNSEDKGYSKAAVKWFSSFKTKRGLPKDTKVFHCFRHTFINLMPPELSEINRKRLVGHEPGSGVHEKTYLKASNPDYLVQYVAKVSPAFPVVALFNQIEGLRALNDAMARKRV